MAGYKEGTKKPLVQVCLRLLAAFETGQSHDQILGNGM